MTPKSWSWLCYLACWVESRVLNHQEISLLTCCVSAYLQPEQNESLRVDCGPDLTCITWPAANWVGQGLTYFCPTFEPIWFWVESGRPESDRSFHHFKYQFSHLKLTSNQTSLYNRLLLLMFSMKGSLHTFTFASNKYHTLFNKSAICCFTVFNKALKIVPFSFLHVLSVIYLLSNKFPSERLKTWFGDYGEIL